ncbi:nucleoid-associated protein YejK [Glaciecola petra]|uniref:Nucleoid-associated protein YejK n=1 Tax=Glaciecola petra TaxID=3075602 RepID=A0ABU2ZPA2_9ALTE|nr:nucleoid-associated protein YejK [Aestuariibacter sp. P117]MDT0594430.1 nucleoid-associated protein YejK [Aestuariibacter sp. P117]
MSANVKQFVVHQISLSEDGKLHFIPKSNCFELSPAIYDLAAQLHHVFNAKPSKGVGGFGDTVDPTFRQHLEALQNDSLDFHGFSVEASQQLLKAIVDEAMVETGYVIFSQYDYLATDYLMIAMLDAKELVTVNNDLELSQNRFLELSKMQIAVRIDLTQLEVDEQNARYISFIKGRMGRKVSDFFMNFIGCEEKVDTKVQNKEFVRHVDDYLSTQQLAPNEKNDHRQAVSKYYKDKASMGEEVEISEVNNILPRLDEVDHSFTNYNKNLETPLEEKFQADKSMLNAMNKFSGAGKGMSLSFDKKLLGDNIHYDKSSDTLTIVGLPPNLKDQLIKSVQGGSH